MYCFISPEMSVFKHFKEYFVLEQQVREILKDILLDLLVGLISQGHYLIF